MTWPWKRGRDEDRQSRDAQLALARQAKMREYATLMGRRA